MIGGTVFLGRHIVEYALGRGHEVTLFNRGQHGADLFPQVEKLKGDRDGGLDPLKGRQWDVVIDTCGYVPRVVSASARLLADAAEHYTYVSSCSVYALEAPNPDENTPVLTMPDETVEEYRGEYYGPLKALCEQAAEAAMPGRVLNVRPGLIVGPCDPSDRFSYWPARLARGGEVMAPGRPEREVQVIDGRDLGAWIVRMAEARKTGVYNATGPSGGLTMETVVKACQAAAGSVGAGAKLTWIPDGWLKEHSVGAWMEMPLWIPEGDADGMFSVNISKAVADGLTFRPIAETVRDTLAWLQTRPAEYAWRAGLKAEKEAELLAAWHNG